MNQLIIRRILATAGAVAITAATVIGCSNSTDNSAESTAAATTAAAAQATSSQATNSSDPAIKEITDAFVTFFDGNTPADKKITLVENGSTFAAAITQQASSPMAAGSTATVADVKLDDTANATVTYSILINGSPALPNQNGKAVNIDGQWKVAAVTYCGLLKIQGGAPAGC